MFIDFLLTDMRIERLDVKNLRIFLSAHELFHGKKHYDRQLIRAVFEKPFKDARDRVELRIAQEGSRFEAKFYTNQQRGFGMGKAPKKPAVSNPFQTV